MTPPIVSVIGLGCIGGSLVQALSPTVANVRGWTTSAADAAAARGRDLDVPETLELALSDANVVVIAVPVQAIGEVALHAIRAAPASATIVHCGGVQSREALRVDEAMHARVLGTHPLAGSHESGFAAARADLFRDRAVSVDARRTPAQDRVVTWLWESAGAARIDYRSADEHDVLMAWISHLPQLASTALAATLAREKIAPELAGPGARDTTRLAASAFDQWSGILQAHPATLDCALARLESTIADVRTSLATGDQRALRDISGRCAQLAARSREHCVTSPIEVRVPGDKSLSHRALIFSALATGRSRVRDMLHSADVHSTAGVLRALGVAVPALDVDITIDARGARALRPPTHRSRLRQQRHDDAPDGGCCRRLRVSARAS